MLKRIHLRRLFLQGAVLCAFVLFPAVTLAASASLRSLQKQWPERHFKDESAGIHFPFEYVKGHIYVTVSVNGKPGYEFLLDSGTSVDVLDFSASRALGIPMENITRAKDLGLGGGKVSMAGARNVELQMQNSQMQSVQIGTSVAIVDLHGLGEAMHHRLDGILGYPLLRKFAVELNFETDEVVLWPERHFSYHGHGNIIDLVEQRDHVPAIPITVGTLKRKTRQALVEIDTGSDASLLLYSYYAKRAHLDTAFFHSNSKLKPGESYGLGGCFPVLPAVFASLTMGNVIISHYMAFLMQTSPAVTRHKISGVLGTSVLSTYRNVIFDVPHGRVIFELPPALPLTQSAKLGQKTVPPKALPPQNLPPKIVPQI